MYGKWNSPKESSSRGASYTIPHICQYSIQSYQSIPTHRSLVLKKRNPYLLHKAGDSFRNKCTAQNIFTSFQNPCAVFQSLYTLIPKSQFKKVKTDRESLCTEQRAFPRKARVRISSNFELTWGLTFATWFARLCHTHDCRDGVSEKVNVIVKAER